MTRQTVPKIYQAKRQNSNIFFFFFLRKLTGKRYMACGCEETASASCSFVSDTKKVVLAFYKYWGINYCFQSLKVKI